MNKYHIFSIICFIFGFLLLALSVYLGDGKVYWAVIVLVVEGSGLYSLLGVLGIILIFLGFIFLLIAFLSSSFELISLEDLERDELGYEYYETVGARPKKAMKRQGTLTKSGKTRSPPYPPERRPQPQPRRQIKTGGVVFIGPIPIIWGSDNKIAYMMAIVSVVLVVIFLIFALAWLF